MLEALSANSAKRAVSGVKARDESGVVRAVTGIKVRDNDTVRPVYGVASAALAAFASPDSVSGATSRRNPSPVGTNSTTVNATGGTAPYSYAWSSEPGWTVGSPSGQSTPFTSTVGPGQEATATFICTVTDAKGKTAQANVTATVSNYYEGGGGGVLA